MSVRCQLSPGATGIPAATGCGGEGAAGAGRGGARGRGGAGRCRAAGLESRLRRWLPAARTGVSGSPSHWAWLVAETAPPLRRFKCGGSSFPGPPRVGRRPQPRGGTCVFTSLGPAAREPPPPPKARWACRVAPHFSPGGGTVLSDFIAHRCICFIKSQNCFFFFFIKIIRVQSFYILSQSVMEGCLTTAKLISCSPSRPCTLSCSPEAAKPRSTPRAASGICLFLNNVPCCCFY